jgi:hypothetical protein
MLNIVPEKGNEGDGRNSPKVSGLKGLEDPYEHVVTRVLVG